MKKENKLIAEFMGFHEIMLDEESKYDASDILHILDMTVNPCIHFDSPLDTVEEDELRFHSSWDWLMPVLKKIKDVADERGIDIFDECEMDVDCIKDEIWRGSIEGVFVNVVAIIEFLNHEQNTQ